MSQLHGRPLYERRAMFLACFLIFGTTILSLWASHMYNRFGVAFVNQSREAGVGGISFAGGTGRQDSFSEDAGGLKGPLGIFRENVQLVREGTANLFSALSPFLQSLPAMTELSPVLPEEGSGPEEKLPPVVQPLSDKPGLLEEEPVDVFASSGNEAVLVLGSEVSVGDEAKSESEGSGDPEASGGEGDVLQLVFVEMNDMSQTNRADWQSNQGVAVKPVKKFSPVSVLSSNFAIMGQAMSDFFEYLTE
ncbi:MAG: hypothetical protein HYW90_01125 [Candidatus Sungbacteria bacterium]|nr:hypothetical protein [Candidatus Sungbacteria bacterium]